MAEFFSVNPMLHLSSHPNIKAYDEAIIKMTMCEHVLINKQTAFQTAQMTKRQSSNEQTDKQTNGGMTGRQVGI